MARPPRWLVFGNFNLIYQAADKSNNNLNRRMMSRFKTALDAMRLRELCLSGRKFTWSNGSTMTRIDRFFYTSDWDVSFPSAILQALPSSISDHAPLLLLGAEDIPKYSTFRFESFWLRMEGFQEIVQGAWAGEVPSADPIRRFHVKLERTAKALKRWHRNFFGPLRLQLAIAREVIGRLDIAQESRALSSAERQLRLSLRSKILGIAVINKTRIRQRARLSNIKLGDANTRLFHLRANGRRRKNFKHVLAADNGLAVTHSEKAGVIQAHFSEFLGKAQPRQTSLDWQQMGYSQRDLSNLETPFSLEELKKAVFALPAEKAPGSDGFIGRFYRSCWETICDDLFEAIVFLAEQGGSSFGLLNKACIVLLPKKADTRVIVDY
jgi:hypothetical protein